MQLEEGGVGCYVPSGPYLNERYHSKYPSSYFRNIPEGLSVLSLLASGFKPNTRRVHTRQLIFKVRDIRIPYRCRYCHCAISARRHVTLMHSATYPTTLSFQLRPGFMEVNTGCSFCFWATLWVTILGKLPRATKSYSAPLKCIQHLSIGLYLIPRMLCITYYASNISLNSVITLLCIKYVFYYFGGMAQWNAGDNCRWSLKGVNTGGKPK